MTEIVITGENKINAAEVGMRPAISFTRGTIRWFTLGHDDMLGYDIATGQKKKSVLIPGTMSINCCSRNDLESEQLAFIITEQLWLNRDLLMRAGFFEVGREPVLGAPSPAGSLVTNDSGEEWYVTSVTCPFQFYRTGTVTPLGAEIANSIDMSLHTGAIDPNNPPYSSQGPFRTTANSGIANGVSATLHTELRSVPAQGYPYAASGLPYAVDAVAPPAFSPASDARGASPDPAGSADTGLQQHLVPHPLNPARMVVVRAASPFRRGVQPPAIHGRSIPLSSDGVEESSALGQVKATVKV
jgi:hypothetical protein